MDGKKRLFHLQTKRDMLRVIFRNLFLGVVAALFFTACDKDKDEASGVDARFVGTWVRDESVSGVVEQVYTLVLNADGAASYSWYRHSNTIGNSGHSSEGTWRYDETENRIVTDLTTSATGSAMILEVINITSTTLVVKNEGSSNSRTYVKK